MLLMDPKVDKKLSEIPLLWGSTGHVIIVIVTIFLCVQEKQ